MLFFRLTLRNFRDKMREIFSIAQREQKNNNYISYHKCSLKYMYQTPHRICGSMIVSFVSDMKQHLKKIYNQGMYTMHVELSQRNETQRMNIKIDINIERDSYRIKHLLQLLKDTKKYY